MICCHTLERYATRPSMSLGFSFCVIYQKRDNGTCKVSNVSKIVLIHERQFCLRPRTFVNQLKRNRYHHFWLDHIRIWHGLDQLIRRLFQKWESFVVAGDNGFKIKELGGGITCTFHIHRKMPPAASIPMSGACRSLNTAISAITSV